MYIHNMIKQLLKRSNVAKRYLLSAAVTTKLLSLKNEGFKNSLMIFFGVAYAASCLDCSSENAEIQDVIFVIKRQSFRMYTLEKLRPSKENTKVNLVLKQHSENTLINR